MKKLLLLFLLIALGQLSQAQTEVMLRFDHRLDGKAFALNQEATSPKGTKYKTTRLQFYISGLKITHDGAQELALNNVYLFVDPSNPNSNEFSLGTFSNISTIEKIDFGIGVDAASNHLDPASYAPDHALAPKNPTMHWGWTAGYRFISLSANAARTNGSFLDVVNIEGLGDTNFKTKSYPAQTSIENGKIYIDFSAEYNLLLDGIVIAGGVNNHGETGSAAVLIANGSQKVFSPFIHHTATKDAYNNLYSKVIYGGNAIFIKYSFISNSKLEFKLYDLNGKTIQESILNTKEGILNINDQVPTGSYFYSFTQEQQVVSTGKLVKR